LRWREFDEGISPMSFATAAFTGGIMPMVGLIPTID
jgi:hypothetical protein